MSALETILTRRSIRSYTDQSISDDQIEQLLKAAMSAPTARNTQSWQFVVIKDRNKLNSIPEFHPFAEMMKQASCAIAVCADLKKEPDINYANTNCSAAAENILLAAHAMGLGAVWLGVFPREKRVQGMKRLLDLPDFIVPIALISLGYPAEEKKQSNRYDKGKIHFDTWQGKEKN